MISSRRRVVGVDIGAVGWRQHRQMVFSDTQLIMIRRLEDTHVL